MKYKSTVKWIQAASNKSFISSVLWLFFADDYSNRGHSFFVKYWVTSLSIFELRAVYLLDPMASHV